MRHCMFSRKRTLVVLTALSLGTMLSPAAQAARFVDIAAEAGVAVQSKGGGWSDYNGDGCVDLLMTQDGTPGLWQNDCTGHFTEVSDAAGITGPTSAWAAVWVDFDGDGDSDAFITSSGTDGPKLWRNNNGVFQDVSVPAGLSAAGGWVGASWADYDGDGDLDVFLAGRFGGGDVTDRLYRNDEGAFVDVAAQAGVAGAADRLTFMGAWFDYDMDGDQDLYLAIDFNPDVLYQNNGDGTFTDVSVAAGINGPGHGMGVAVEDFNYDGCLDILSSNNGRGTAGDPEEDDHGPSILYLNNCDGTFSVATTATGIEDRGVVEWGVNFVDYDNDGDLDFSVVAGGMLTTDGEPNALYENDGDYQLFDITDTAGVANGFAAFGSVWADIDNDGDMDWLVNNTSGGPNALFRNDSAVGHYLKVDLQGIGRNADAIGAIVNVTAGSRTQSRLISAGTSYVSSQELVAHFGLGVKDVADVVTVVWPNNGGVTEVFDVAADQTIVIAQTQTPPPVLPGTVSGAVFDPIGLPVGNARVDIRDPETRQTIVSVATDSNGNFFFDAVVPGDYSISAFHPAFFASRTTRFALDSGEDEIFNLSLRPPL